MPLAAEGLTDAIGMTEGQLYELGFESIPHRTEPTLPDWRHARAPADLLVESAPPAEPVV